jgi:glutamate synthase (NADPH/NADH) small chain
VGSGPAGLACADDLARQGCSVTVYDDDLFPGGLLVKGVPTFKLEDTIIERRLNLMKQRGVRFELGATVLAEGMLTRLREDHDAVFLGFDSREARPLEVPGADLNGVVQAVAFILQTRTPIKLRAPRLNLAGKHVTVIGGGDTALDCARAALRWGAREAVCAYRRGEEDLPCDRQEYRDAIEEGVRFLFHAMPAAILGTTQAQVRALSLIRTEPGERQPDGRHAFSPVLGSEAELETDLVICALGFNPKPCFHGGDFAELHVNEWGGLVVNESQMTNLPGVFAGGDIVRGPSLVLVTVRDARRAADGIMAYLRLKA